jgi:hypothetical protein
MANELGGPGPHSIEFILDPAKGTIESIKPTGVAGPGCQALTAPFERRFGGSKTDTKLPEYYQTEQVKQIARLGGGGI